MECEFCKSQFVAKRSLKTHQQTAKYCLAIRNKVSKFICSGCDKILSSCQRLLSHQQNCISYHMKIKELEHKNEINKLVLKVEEQKDQIQCLQDKLHEVLLKSISRPTTSTNTSTTTTNQVTINNYIQKLDRITDDYFIEQVPNLTIEHIKNGPKGYATYALKHPLSNRMLCVDYARRKVKYKDKDGNVITDPEMNNLSKKLFEAIKEKNKVLIIEYLNALSDDFDTEAKLKIMSDLSDLMIMVNSGANGTKNDLYHEFVKNVCSQTLVD
jgi:hypothetical protein